MKKGTRDLLKKRAAAVAIESEMKTSVSDVIELIIFKLGAETYGIASSFVREIYPLKEYTPLPGLPPFILGLIHVRRQILPVVDLKVFLDLPNQGLGELNKVIILQNEQMEFGILADVVQGTQSIEPDEIREAPPTVVRIGEEYLMGVTRERLIVLNAESLLTDKRLIVIDE